MSRFDSDMDYSDEPWNKPEPCATRGCENSCDVPSMSAFCYECRTADLIARANAPRADEMATLDVRQGAA